MGKFREITGAKKEKAGIREATGVSARAGQEAARVLEAGTREAIGEIRGVPETVGATLDPFISAGQQALGGIFGAISPQRDFQLQTDPSRVLQNPFFQALAAEQEQRLMASQAARGKVGAGETTNLLQRNLLQLGSQFQQQDIANQLAQAQAQSQLEQQRFGQLFGLGQMGFGAAGQLAGTQEATATNLANLITSGAAQQAGALTDIGNIQAAGIRGAASTQAAAQGALANLGMQAAGGALAGGMGLLGSVGGTQIGAGGGALLGVLCDETQKDIIKPVKVDDDGLTVYEFTYKHDPSNVYHGKMAQDIQKIDPDNVFERNGVLMVTEKYKPEVVNHGT